MKNRLKCVLLVDDNMDCNYLHKRTLNKMGCVDKIQIALNGKEALEFLLSEENGVHPQPDIIFLDVNMPVMNGWDFLDEYEKIDENQKAGIILVMLTTSLNKNDRERAAHNKYVDEFIPKYLDEAGLNKILNKYFKENQ